MTGFDFFLGIHEAVHLERVSVAAFISRSRLDRRKRLPVANTRWALDSGGFSELALHGEWTVSPADYAASVRYYSDGIEGMAFAAPQDWMVEPEMIRRTGLTVAEHQRRTVDNYVELCTIAADLPFIPVLQGQSLDDYRRHAALYAAAGIDLIARPLVGLGSVCRRQSTADISSIVAGLADDGFKLHGFGMKQNGLRQVGNRLTSADSMAWSFQARRKRHREPGCTHRAADCRDCLVWALRWRERVLDNLGAPCAA